MENWMCNVLPPCILDSEYAMHQITGPQNRQVLPFSGSLRILLQLQQNSWLVSDLVKWSILTHQSGKLVNHFYVCIYPTFLQTERQNVTYSTQCAQQWVGSSCIFHEKYILHFLFEILDWLIFEEFYCKVLSILNEKIIIWNFWVFLQNTKGMYVLMCSSSERFVPLINLWG